MFASKDDALSQRAAALVQIIRNHQGVTMATLNKTEAFDKLRQLGVPGGEPFDLEEELTEVLIDALEERYNYPVDASYALYLANDLKVMAVRIAKLATSMKEIADDE